MPQTEAPSRMDKVDLKACGSAGAEAVEAGGRLLMEKRLRLPVGQPVSIRYRKITAGQLGAIVGDNRGQPGRRAARALPARGKARQSFIMTGFELGPTGL